MAAPHPKCFAASCVSAPAAGQLCSRQPDAVILCQWLLATTVEALMHARGSEPSRPARGCGSLAGLKSFAAWLPTHCGLVSSIDYWATFLCKEPSFAQKGAPCATRCSSEDMLQARAVLASALQRCAATAAASHAGGHGKRCCLRKFSCTPELADPAVLKALLAAALPAQAKCMHFG